MICAKVCVLLVIVAASKLDASNSLSKENVLKRLLKDSESLRSSLMENNIHLATQNILDILADVSVIPSLNEYPNDDLFTEEIQTIIRNIKTFQVFIMNTGQKIDRLINYYELFELRNKILLDVSYINNCLEWFLHYISSNRQQLYSCYNIFTKHISEYGKVLNEEVVSFYRSKMYHQIIELKGYCDGTRVLNIFQYILGIYSEGCIAAVAVESIKYNYSNLIMQECQTNIRKGLLLFQTTSEKCKMQDCEKIISGIKEKTNESDVYAAAKSLRGIFPWYYFLIIHYNEEIYPDIEFFGETLSYVAIPSFGQIKKLIMWSEYANNYTHAESNVYEYGVEYISSSANSSIDQMRLNTWYKPGERKLRLVGYHSFVGSDKVKPRCLFDQSEMMNSSFDRTLYLETWKLCLIFGLGGMIDLCLIKHLICK